MKKVVSTVITILIVVTIVSFLVTFLFGNTSWLSGTGLTAYDKVYIGEGGALRSAGESAMKPISRAYDRFSRRVQKNSKYDWEVESNSSVFLYLDN